jgi:trimeric autotransporter adhesin
MASLFNTRISDTYQGLIKSIDNAALTATLKELTDGTGVATGVYMNTAGDFKVNAILEFGSLKDTGENIIITKFVDAADGIANNDNDTTIPTTAAIVDYVAAQITIEDLDFTGDTGSGQIDLDSQIFAIGGTVNEITTVASGQSLTLSLDSTGVYLPNNSTATTQTAGDNSTKLATTSYVDTLDAASDLDFSGDSGTGDINLNTEVLAVTGTANQIETTASGVGLSLSFPSAGITLPNGSVATTQTAGNNSTKVATTAYVDVLDAASDLDITGDTGTGDVNLNTQTLNIIGTPNEVTTAVVNQTATISLPSSISVDLVGNVTGNLTGNVTGNLTGNSAGTHTGAVVGNVTGNVIGNVTGALTGNADTSTAWQTARDLSVTGEATGIISNIDGTSNESGAITLDNNSVTGKVLTGLPTPSASSVLATDSIVEGIGKLQSQINGLAGGLRFMGSWDATANSPVLGSGGGEAAAGTTTSAAANKLIQTGQTFLSTVSVGDQVVNQVDGQSALVTNVDSNTTLSLDSDIMLSGESYTIDNSPFITQGNYYVVSVGGTTSLNGINQWTIGDWVIAGANNEWTKLDHSQVDGTGTVGNLTKWSSTSVIADSIVSESGTAITVDGSLTTNTNLSSTGNFAVNTDKFTVGASSGNTAFTGNLAINTNKFTVNATSGNTVAAGTITSPTFLGDLNGTINTLTTAVTQSASNNSTKVATTAYADAAASAVPIGNYLPLAGGTMTGVTQFNDHTYYGDQVAAKFGASQDLQIYHDGSNSYISDTGTGSLKFTSSDIIIQTIGLNAIIGEANQGIKLYYNGSKKFETTSTGISVSGNNLDIKGTSSGNTSVRINAITGTAGTNSLDLINDGTAAYIWNRASTPILFGIGGTERMRIASNGITTIGMTNLTGSAAVRIGSIGDATSNGTGKLQFVNSNSYPSWQISAGGTPTGSLAFTQSGTNGADNFTVERMRIDSEGNVTIQQDSGTIYNATANQAGGLFVNNIYHEALNTFSQISLGVSGASGASSARIVAIEPGQARSDLAFVLRDGSGYNERLRIVGETGNVEIGTASATSSAKLTVQAKGVNGSDETALVLRNYSASPFTGYVTTEYEIGTVNIAEISARRVDINSGQLIFRTKQSGTITDALTIDSSGNVGIGRTSIAQPTTGATTLAIQGTTTTSAGAIRLYSSDDSVAAYIFADNANGLSINTSTSHPMVFRTVGVDRMRILATGNITLNSVVYGNTVGGTNRNLYIDNVGGIGGIASIRAAKKNIENISSVDWMYQLNPVTFNYRKKDEDGNYTDEAYDHITYGLIAEDTQPIADFLINYNEDEDGTKEMKGIEYSRLMVPLLKAIQELKAEVDKLKQECNCKN